MKVVLWLYCFTLLGIVSCSSGEEVVPAIQEKAASTEIKIPGVEPLRLALPKTSFDKILAKREEALRNGILQKTKDDLVPAVIDAEYGCEVRLKGDWVDHLEGDKWSFRVELEDDQTWHGHSKFSIQSPEARAMLNEWVYHQMLGREGIVSTSYDFLPVELNGKSMGIMAIEGHFTNELLEAHNRPTGPILKFNEDPVWEARADSIPNMGQYPYLESALISGFSRKKTQANEALNNLLEKGRSLLLSNQLNLLPADSIFDLDKLAKYYAISEVFGAWHSYVWHNLRYYYNPRSDRLEPIGFDGSPTIRKDSLDMPFFRMINQPFNRQKRRVNLFSSQIFKEKLAIYLDQFSRPDYMNSFIVEVQPTIDSLVNMLNQDYPDYNFNTEDLRSRASIIQDYLSDFQLEGVEVETLPFRDLQPSFPPRPYVSVGAYQTKVGENLYGLELVNYYYDTLLMTMFHGEFEQSESSLILEPFESPVQAKLERYYTPYEVQKLKFRVLNGEDSVEIIPYPYCFPK